MLNNAIAKLLQTKILSGEYPPGEALPGQRVLAAELGVSRPALREALSVLETLGLIDIRQARGVFVPDPKNMATSSTCEVSRRTREVFQFRLAAEPYAAAMASRLRSNDDLERLKGTLYRMRYALDEGQLIDAVQEDFNFHHIIFSILQNSIFTDTRRRTATDIHSAQCKPLRNKEEVMKPLEEHQQIINAIRDQSPERASAAMAYHIRAAAIRGGLSNDDI
ncbi:MAG: GntR family transcriptional repressor for pyruvate dehydrogenase complex [Marinobacter maritimus]|jgi:GntR family transcriptional repressor for pyruvate dehydrogenase complex|uniref:FadR/GntR family transcriptional regulator n=1 Tax=Marinobacter maritimus TaxID=277961 RepID=UPI000BD25524|nr:FCD domain-containing protein [Marinobacter maritimus]MBL1272119.1 FadR family transcriptional regulator [Oceanospirillales bacterium]|tara:strand:- start:74 stop:739 length:666 start_codon:yes stop_codon:yes gene_type:complete